MKQTMVDIFGAQTVRILIELNFALQIQDDLPFRASVWHLLLGRSTVARLRKCFFRLPNFVFPNVHRLQQNARSAQNRRMPQNLEKDRFWKVLTIRKIAL